MNFFLHKIKKIFFLQMGACALLLSTWACVGGGGGANPVNGVGAILNGGSDGAGFQQASGEKGSGGENKTGDGSGDDSGDSGNGFGNVIETVAINQPLPEGNVNPIKDVGHQPKYVLDACVDLVEVLPFKRVKVILKGNVLTTNENAPMKPFPYESCCSGLTMKVRYNSAPDQAMESFQYMDLPLVQQEGEEGYFEQKITLSAADPGWGFYLVSGPELNSPPAKIQDSNCKTAICYSQLLKYPPWVPIHFFKMDWHDDFLLELPNCANQIQLNQLSKYSRNRRVQNTSK